MKILQLLEGIEDADFKKWFGKSKVVDSDGNPKKVFRGVHGDNKNIAPAFYTDNTGEASAYTETGSFRRAEKLKSSIKRADGTPLVGKRVPNIGIVSDAAEYNRYDEIWATDNGIVSIDKKGIVTYYDNVVYDSDTYDYGNGENSSIVIKKGQNTDYDDAMEYIDDIIERNYSGGREGRVYPVYLKIENPAQLSPIEANIITQRFGKESEEKGNKLIAKLKKQGYDGIFTQSDEASEFPDAADSMGGIPDQYVPFDKNQVRSTFK